jgi:hypothetical protein
MRLPAKSVQEIERFWWSIDDDGKPAWSPGEIARKLNDLPDPPPRPGAPGTPWNAAAVKTILRTLRNQREVLLRRLGSLLAVVDHHGRISPIELTRLCREHQVDAYWVWDRWRLPYLELHSDFGRHRYSPPLELRDDYMSVAPEGRRVIELWRQLHTYPAEVQDVLEALSWKDYRLRPEALFRVCERLDASFDVVVASGLVRPAAKGGLFEATAAGRRVGDRWRLIAGQDEGRWEYEYRPEAEEEVSLPLDWDWDDRPLLWAGAQLGVT